MGLANFVGDMGAFAGDRITGTLADGHGWHTVVGFWTGGAAAAAVGMAARWNRQG